MLGFREGLDRLSKPTYVDESSGCESHRCVDTDYASAYSCDRDLGMALGRPPAIQDEWIAADVSQ